MAEDTPGLAADLLAAIGGSGGEPAVEKNDMKVEPAPELATASATAGEENGSLKRARTEDATENTAPEKRQKIDGSGETLEDAEGPSTSYDISAMLQNAFASLDEEQLTCATPVDGDRRSLPPPDASPITPPGPTQKTMQNQIRFASKPFHVMRSMSLPVLGNLAVQILLALSQQARSETLELLGDGSSPYRQALDLLLTSFESARKQFSTSRHILSPDELDIKEFEDRETIRMANLATATSRILLAQPLLSPDEINENALRVFVAEDGELSEECAHMLLALKTRSALTRVSTLEGLDNSELRKDVVETYFPLDFKEALKRRNLFGGPLTAVEERLLKDMKMRRGELQDAVGNAEQIKEIVQKHSEESLLDLVGSYLQSQVGSVVDYAEKYGINIPSVDDALSSAVLGEPMPDQDDKGQASNFLAAATPANASSQLRSEVAQASTGVNLPIEDGLGLGILLQSSLGNQPTLDASDDAGANGTSLFEGQGLASLIAEKLSTLDGKPNAVQSSYSEHLASLQSPHLAHLYQGYDNAYQAYDDGSMPQPAQTGPDGDNLPPNQSFPTSVLYERARQAAVAKSSAHARREGIHSTRRPWSSEEEKALMAGLDMVKGPHWSQILTLFGPNGTISDILKDRTQVQLKDKARNLKLFFLKTNSEMPYYLQCVTGELKTRAPGQAARKEAEEKARLNSEEEQARIQGIMTLAGGLQNNSAANGANHAGGVPSATPPSRIGPPSAQGLAALQSRLLAPNAQAGTAQPSVATTTTTTLNPSIKADAPSLAAALSSQRLPGTSAASQSPAPALPQTIASAGVVPARVPTPHNPGPVLPARSQTASGQVSRTEPAPTAASNVAAEQQAPVAPPVDVSRPAQTAADTGQESGSLVQALKAVVAGPSS